MSKFNNELDNLSEKQLSLIGLKGSMTIANINITRKTIDILIDRHTQSPQSTLGTLSIPKFDFNAYTLERAGPDETARGLKKRVPIGTYQVKWHDTTLNQQFPYSFNLYNAAVPADRYILIHIGNEPEDSDGCILLGSAQSANFVSTSAKTIYAFYDLFKGVDITKVRVIITESY